jgi:hypothetical protein
MPHNVNDIVHTAVEHWVAVTGAYRCFGCGHTHHGRQLHRDGRAMLHVAIMYSYCDEPDCRCERLQVT